MRKTKFWLIQIVMLVMVSLIFGSAAFAGGPSGNSNAKGAEMSKANANANAKSHANENAAFYEEELPLIIEEEEDDEFALCVESGQIIFNSDGSVTFCP